MIFNNNFQHTSLIGHVGWAGDRFNSIRTSTFDLGNILCHKTNVGIKIFKKNPVPIVFFVYSEQADGA